MSADGTPTPDRPSTGPPDPDADLLPDHAATSDQPDREPATDDPAIEADAEQAEAAALAADDATDGGDAADAAAQQSADDPGYAANAPANEAAPGVHDDPTAGTDQPVSADQVSDDTPLGSEDPMQGDDLPGDTGLPAQAVDESPEPIDGIDEDLDSTVDGTGESEAETAELSADVRALERDDPGSAAAFDDSSSVVESDMDETGVEVSAGDGGDEHAVDDAVADLPDDRDGLTSPDR